VWGGGYGATEGIEEKYGVGGRGTSYLGVRCMGTPTETKPPAPHREKSAQINRVYQKNKTQVKYIEKKNLRAITEVLGGAKDRATAPKKERKKQKFAGGEKKKSGK